MRRDREPTPMEAAFLQAFAEYEKKQQEPRSTGIRRSKKPRIIDEIPKSIDFRREESDKEAETIAAIFPQEATISTFHLRKPTVHNTPDETVVELRRIQEVNQARYQAKRIGAAWSKWLNEARPSGWRHLDQSLVASWTDLLLNTTFLPLETRRSIIESTAEGMGLSTKEEFIRKPQYSTDANQNKMDYVFSFTKPDKKNTIGTAYRVEIGSSLSTGAFLSISFEDLSGHREDPQQKDSYYDFQLAKMDEIKRSVGIQDTIDMLAEWLGRPDVREHFIRRKAALDSLK